MLQEWENAPDQSSSRPGDPPTNARQFARGYIGLQNHGNPDVIDYRNIRVLPLDEGAVTGPLEIEGDGEHTVEFRSTDAAGNEEDVKEVTFTIGDADTTAPATGHSLDPANPGAGGTYSGPVAVTLTADDPETGGSEPQEHDVDATPTTWSPDEVTAVSGDTVTWNFPTTAGPVHDVWVMEPGSAGNAAGTQVTSGPVSAGGPPVSREFEQTGQWRYVCKIHSFVDAGQWTGMVGTVDVAAAEPGTSSGVDFTEYRVNTGGATGEWVQSENAEGDDPFATAFTVSAEGQHQVEYRSTDNAGNAEATKSVAFTIAGTNVAPTVTASATPTSGTAPLRVQFASQAADADGDALTTAWAFGNGATATGASPAYTYTQPGTYTARVTVTDPSGASASATVRIVVTTTSGGNNPPGGGNNPPGNNPPGGNPPASNRLRVTVAKRIKARTAQRRGVKVQVRCSIACRTGAVLRIGGRKVGTAKTVRIGANGRKTLVIRLDRRTRRNLLVSMRRAGVKSRKATVVLTVRAADGRKTVRRTVRIVR